MKPSILPFVLMLIPICFSGCESLQLLSYQPDVSDIEEQINDNRDEESGERRITGPNITSLYHHTYLPIVRLKATVDEDGTTDIQMHLTVKASAIYGYKRFHTATTAENLSLEFVDANENIKISPGSSIVDPSSSAAYSERVDLKETAKISIPLEFLEEKAHEGFYVTFLGERGKETVAITAEYAQAFLTKLKSPAS